MTDDGILSVRALLARHGEPVPTPVQLLPNLQPDVIGVEIFARSALDAWATVRAATDYTGFYPVILGYTLEEAVRFVGWTEWLAQRVPDAWIDATAEQIITEAQSRFAGDWFITQHSRMPEVMRPENADVRQRWPDDVRPLSEFHTLGDHERTTLGLFPTREPWQFPAYRRWRVVNADRTPLDHCIVMRHWYERYGAEVVAVHGEAIVQFRVLRPPRDRRTAMQLAVEHSLYCFDRVDQGTGTIERLAATLLDAPVWYFWFD